VQALARIIVMDAAVRIKQRVSPYGIGLALQVHDALAAVIPEELVTWAGNIMKEEMNRTVKWAPELPLAADFKTGPTYGDCK
jgi:DNA polymerase I-like protein with 3'-5' exonuclease and polymerase domains